jgi:HD-GYP domain-containing protein (c-di-GMP phosphodiesterase class II)
MTKRPEQPAPAPAGDGGRDLGPMIAARFLAVLRTGRSYAIENPAFTTQLEQLLELLGPLLRVQGEVAITAPGDELHFDGRAIASGMAGERQAGQLVQELLARQLVGVRFLDGLTMPELLRFMRYFVPAEIHLGADLERVCAAQGIRHALPLPAGQAAPRPGVDAERPEIPSAYAAALEAYQRARRDLRALIPHGTPCGVEASRLKRALHPLVDAAFAGSAVSAGLDDLDWSDAEPSVHGLRVGLLVADIARRLGLERAAVVELAVAGLLHAVNTGGTRAGHDDVSRARARRAAISRLSESMPLGPATLLALRIPLDETPGVSPRPLASEVIGIADRYVALASSRRHGGPRRTPCEALGIVLGPLATDYHPAIRAALVGALGVYPPGQFVELDDGTRARVAAANPDDPERPMVERVPEAAGRRMSGLDENPVMALPEARTIRRALPFDRREAPAA